MFLDDQFDSKRTSVANSTLSQAASTRHMLAPSNNHLLPPLTPTGSANNSTSNLSLTINYIPSKFSSGRLSPSGAGPRRRKGGPNLPKLGGGVEAFRSGANRIPGGADEDDDDGYGGTERKKRWTKFKWILVFTNSLLTIWSFAGFILCLLVHLNVWTHADIVRVGNRPELILSTVASVCGIVTCVVGWAGILMNNRAFITWYNYFTWFTFIFLLVPGYITYKKQEFNLEGKVSHQWSRILGADGRLRIQNELGCCGFFSPYVEATVSGTCYSRSILAGCKKGYMDFQEIVCTRWFIAVFSIVPVQLAIMISALLCGNHVTYRFGKGMTPKAYRLSMNTMAVIMDNYANQLAEQYGPDVAADIVNRSRSNLHLPDSKSGSSSPLGGPGMPMPMTNLGSQPSPGGQHVKYDSVGI